MEITVPLTEGFLPDEYTGKASDADKLFGVAVKSFPITIKNAPTATQSFALQLLDYDATPVCGFPWIHWLAANLPAATTTIMADASRSNAIPMLQGKNSSASPLLARNQALHTGYTGPNPPTGLHHYYLTVFALDAYLNLPDGFWYNQFRDAVLPHVLQKATIALPVKA